MYGWLMRAQDFIADETMRAMDDLIRTVTKMPEGKSDWSPLDLGRDARDQVAECALIGASMVDVIRNQKMPEFTPEFMEQYETMKAGLGLEEAVGMLREKTREVCELIREFPDSDLESEIAFWGPNPWKMVRVLNYHNSNMSYHTGQVNYIQTLYGDTQMG